MNKKILIVGGVAGGASTAARLRRMDETAEIILFEKGDYISFANCGLPYYIGETIKQRDSLLLQTPEEFNGHFNVDVRVANKVLSIDRAKKTVEVERVESGETYTENYDILVLSPGSTPLRPPIPGIDAPNIFTLWDIPDTDRIKSYVDTERPHRAAVIGGGFIGIEMAENLSERGIHVSLIEKMDQVMAPVDKDMAEIIHHHLSDQGVSLFIGDGVTKFEHNNGTTTIYLESGKTVDAEIVMLSIGVRPQTELAKQAGLELNQRGGIKVNGDMMTSDPSIYAVGDAVEIEDFNTKQPAMVPLAGPANKQGRIAANNIAGIKDAYMGTQGTSIAKVYDLTVAGTGLNEKQLNRMGKKIKEDYHAIIIHSKSNAGYYPGAIPMVIKLVFDLKGKVLGAQIVGYVGVDKRIDVLATAIRLGATVENLTDLELAYAPPYGSAKDPVNMVGFVAQNVLTDKMDYIFARELKQMDLKDVVILDVRTEEERMVGYVENSVNIPLDQLRSRLSELDRNKLIVVYCAVGQRGYLGTRILMQNGFKKVKNLLGGYTSYGYVFEPCEFCEPPTLENLKDKYDDAGFPTQSAAVNSDVNYEIDACGLQCPGPIMKVYKKMDDMNKGEVLRVVASDPGFAKDIKSWCTSTGNVLVDNGKQDHSFYAVIRKGEVLDVPKTSRRANDKAMIVFSDDLDKAIATFIIANGAASMGRKVTLFFTFWGINVVRKQQHVAVKKDFISNMFGKMMPRGTQKLGLSKMNMGGVGSKMIRGIMKKHNVDSLEELMQQAMDNGVKFVVCNMSMDLLGLHPEELIDGVEFGGVASYLGAAEDSDMSLFI